MAVDLLQAQDVTLGFVAVRWSLVAGTKSDFVEELSTGEREGSRSTERSTRLDVQRRR